MTWKNISYILNFKISKLIQFCLKVPLSDITQTRTCRFSCIENISLGRTNPLRTRSRNSLCIEAQSQPVDQDISWFLLIIVRLTDNPLNPPSYVTGFIHRGRQHLPAIQHSYSWCNKKLWPEWANRHRMKNKKNKKWCQGTCMNTQIRKYQKLNLSMSPGRKGTHKVRCSLTERRYF